MLFKNTNTKKSQQDELKIKVARAATEYIQSGMGLAIGTGSTVNFFIDELAKIRHKPDFIVSSSVKTTEYLIKRHFKVVDISYTSNIDLYIDGADEANYCKKLIKGGGGALTGEKICRVISNQFICMIDESKLVKKLGSFPIAVEVIPQSRRHVTYSLIKLGGKPIYREDFVTDNGNIILDVHQMDITDPVARESEINQIVGVVSNGIFAIYPADILLIAKNSGLINIVR